MRTLPPGCGIRDSTMKSKRCAASRCKQTPRSDARSGRVLIPPPSPGSIPSPTTKKWGQGEGISKERDNSMERAPLPSPLPARASQGEGHFSNGGCIKMRPLGPVDPNRYCASSFLGVPLRHEFTRLQPAKVSPNNIHSHFGSAFCVLNRSQHRIGR